MDTLGLVISAALCTAVFVLFDGLVRLLGDAVGEIRYTVAPTLLGGLHAWREERSSTAATVPEPPDTASPPGDDAAGPRQRPDRREPGLVVPVTPVARHRAPFAAA